MSYGREALLGILFIAAGIVATKLSSFVSQFALGWLLTTQDYKMWAMAVSLRMFVEGIRHGGMLPIMQQRGAKGRDQLFVFLRYGLVFNLFAACVLLLTVPFAQEIFQTEGLKGLIILMAISFPLSTPGAFYRTCLTIDLQFSVVARITSICAALNYGLMVLFAAVGFGTYSFVLPIVATAMAEWWFYRQAADRNLHRAPLTREAFQEIFAASKWMIFAAIAASVSLAGDYLVIGRFASEFLGEYLFGFQLTMALSVVIAGGFQQVLLPTFSKLQGDVERLADAYRKSVLITSLLAAPVFAAAAVVGPFVVHLLWAGKWDGAIPVVQAMSLCLALRLLNPLASTALQAVGRWDIYASVMALDAIVILVAAWVGTTRGGLRETAIAVGVGRCVVVPIMMFAAARAVGISPWESLRAAAMRIAMPIASVFAVWHYFGFPGDASIRYLVTAGLSLVIAEAIVMWVYRHDLVTLWNLLRRRESLV